MKTPSTIFLIALAVSAPVARAQFGSGIVFDPTQSGHAVQQILQAKQLYTTTVETTQNVIGAYNLARQMASLPQSLYTSYVNLGRQQWTNLTQPANTYGNSLQWINAALTGYSWSKPNSQHRAHRSHGRVWFAQFPRSASDRGPRCNSRSLRFCQCNQSANDRHHPSQRSAT